MARGTCWVGYEQKGMKMAHHQKNLMALKFTDVRTIGGSILSTK